MQLINQANRIPTAEASILIRNFFRHVLASRASPPFLACRQIRNKDRRMHHDVIGYSII